MGKEMVKSNAGTFNIMSKENNGSEPYTCE